MKFKLIKYVLIAGIAALGASTHAAKAENLTVASFLPGPHHIHTRVLSWFDEQIKKDSNGELSLQIFPGGQLGAGPVQQYKRALENVADMTVGVSAYTPTVFPKTMLSILPGASQNAVESTGRIWDAYEEQLSDEYEDVKLIGLFTVAGNVIASTRDASSVEGLSGAKLVPYASMTQPIVEALGAVPVQMPITDVYTGLSTGTIDAAYVSISNMTAPWNFWDVTTYMVEGAPVNFAVLFVVMNKDRYNGLSDEHRKIIDAYSGRAMSMKGAESFDLADEIALKTMAENPDKAASVNRVTVTSEQRAQMDAATRTGLEAIFEDYESRGINDAKAVYDALNK